MLPNPTGAALLIVHEVSADNLSALAHMVLEDFPGGLVTHVLHNNAIVRLEVSRMLLLLIIYLIVSMMIMRRSAYREKQVNIYELVYLHRCF